MKKLLLVLLGLVLCLGILVACDDPGESGEDHTHAYYGSWMFDADMHWHPASCGHQDEKDALTPHDFESAVIREATCEETGSEFLTCKTCGYTKIGNIPALGHDYGEERSYSSSEHYYACTRKGCDSKKDVALHTYDDELDERCNVCDAIREVLCPHSTTEEVKGYAPTCEFEGKTNGFKCSTCGVTLIAQQAIPALRHEVEYHSAKDPTCTENGYQAYMSCKRDGCAYTTYSSIAPLGHDETRHAAKTPTCTEIGWNAYVTCSRCTHTTYAALAALGHDKQSHAGKEATCTAAGWYAYETCSRCSYSTYQSIAPEHRYDIYVVSPTHKEDGYTLHFCTECSHNYKTDIQPALENYYPIAIDSIPDNQYNFGGDELSISVRNDYVYEVYADSTSQDGIDPEIYKRNKYTEDRFNFKIKPLQSLCKGKSDQATHYDDVTLALNKGSFKFDVISMWAYQSGKLVKGMNYLDWRLQNEDGSYVIPYAADSLVGKKEWWPEKMNNAGTVMGHQYVAISDMCITSMEMAYGIVYNYNMVMNDRLPETIGAGNYYDMYQVVKAGEWTLDVLYNLTKDLFVDNPNAGTYGQADDSDAYGLMYQTATGIDAFIHSLGFMCINNDGENMPTLWNMNQTLITAAEDVVALCNSKGAIGRAGDEAAYKFFTEKHVYFATMKLEALRTATMHGMEDDYGILPYPKLNKDQKNYLTGSDDHFNALSIPLMIDPDRYTMIGVTMEALAARTHQTVNSAFYDTLFKTNSTRNLLDAEMIDIIVKGRVYDLVVYHHADLWINKTNSNGHLHAFFRYLVMEPGSNPADYWASGKDLLSAGESVEGSLANLIYQYVDMW